MSVVAGVVALAFVMETSCAIWPDGRVQRGLLRLKMRGEEGLQREGSLSCLASCLLLKDTDTLTKITGADLSLHRCREMQEEFLTERI
jgi:hypothetical protein